MAGRSIAVALLGLSLVLLCGASGAGTEECPYRVWIGAAPLSGHLTPLLGLAQALVKRGCDVTFPVASCKLDDVQSYATVLMGDGSERSMRVLEIDTEAGVMPATVRNAVSSGSKLEVMKMFFSGSVASMFFGLTADYYGPLQAIWEEEGPPDVVLAMPSALGVLLAAEKAGVPLVRTMPGILVDQGAPYHHVPHFSTEMGMSGLDSILGRVKNAVTAWSHSLMMSTMLWPVMEFREEKGLPPLPPHASIMDMHDGIVLQQTTFALEYAQPIPPNVYMIGPVFPKTEKKLDGALERWLDDNENITYLALGSQAMMTPELASNMAEVFRHTGPVLWAVRKEQHHLLPPLLDQFPHVRVEEFLPQRAVLAHPHVTVFWTHNGASSTHEGLYNGLPLLCMPFFSDQPDLAWRVVDAGAGLMVDKSAFDPMDVAEKLQMLHTQERFAEQAAKIRVSFRHAGGAERGVDLLLEAVALGHEHLMLPHRGLGRIAANGWDLFMAEVLGFVVLPVVAFRLLRLTMRKCCGGKSQTR